MATFYWPTPGCTSVTSGFGQRIHPVTGNRSFHLGIDIGVSSGTPVYASRGGVVSAAKYSGTYGNMVLIQHGNNYQTRYAHLSKFSVKAGDSVKAGVQIGLSGATGRVTGSHLHFEVLKNGGAIDPLTVVSPSSRVVSYVDEEEEETETAAASSSTTETVVHIPQTEKVYTSYLSDTTSKPVDAYQIIWRAGGTLTYKDITDRCSAPSLKDDSASVCLEFEFNVMQSTEKYLSPLKLSCGDFVAAVNTATGNCVFAGNVEGVEGSFRESMSVRCLDGGRVLTSNAIILQCNNVPAKTALSQLAGKIGLAINCPDLISSIHEMYHDSASSIAQGILSTVEAENGVPYFLRVSGNTLSVRSFGKTCMRAYAKQASNLAAFDVLAEPEIPKVGWSIEDLRNAVTVYSETDNLLSIEGKAEDAESIKKYGRRQSLVTFSDSDTVSADAKAKTQLKELNQVAEEFSVTTFGSDSVVAGVRMAVNLEEISGEFWVTSVVHDLSTPHRMTMTFRRCTD